MGRTAHGRDRSSFPACARRRNRGLLFISLVRPLSSTRTASRSEPPRESTPAARRSPPPVRAPCPIEVRSSSTLTRAADGRVTTAETAVGEGVLRIDLQSLERRYFGGVGWAQVSPRGLEVGAWPLGWPVLVRLGPAEFLNLEGGGQLLRRPILGGLLAKGVGWVELRWEPLGGTTRLRLEISGFEHQLPQRLYDAVQGPLHRAYTGAFLRAELRRPR
jgi:hypothetical protein